MQHRVGGRVELQGAVRAPDADHDHAHVAPDPGIDQRVVLQARAAFDGKLAQADVVAAAQDMVHELQGVRSGQQVRHALAALHVGGDGVVGPGAQQLALRLHGGRPGDDRQIRLDLPGGEHQVHIVRIAAQRRDQPRRMVDPGPVQAFVVRRVAPHEQVVGLAQQQQRLRVMLDDHEVSPAPHEVVAHGAARAPEAAHHVVIAQLPDPGIHSPSPQY